MAAGLLSLAAFPHEGVSQGNRPPVCYSTFPRIERAQRDSLLQSLEAREVAVTGFVRDEAGAPVPNIIVTVDGMQHGTMTASDGGYLIRFMDREKNIVASSAIGPVVRACDRDREWLAEMREIQVVTPNGDVLVYDVNGVVHPPAGYAIRLDFVVRRKIRVM